MSATKIKETIQARASQQEWHWYQGVAFWAIVQLLTFTFSGLTSIASGNKGKNTRETFFGNPSYFRELKQSVVAPPSWVFAPAWTINNFFAIWAGLRVLNKPKGTPGRTEFLALQAATWVEFVLFNAAYFSLRSPINAFFLTITYFIFTIASGLVAVFRLKDTTVALLLGTLYIWLIIAGTAAAFQVLWNHDDLYNVGPFAEPVPALLKKEA